MGGRTVTRHRPDPLHPVLHAADGTQRPDGIDPSRPPGTTRPPDYVIVVAASDWVTEHFPAAAASLWTALHPGHDRHRDPEPDLEAEP
jgi:hypothetical protein